MYCDFFGLAALPFNNTPDPRFFFNTPEHEEALASLQFAAEQRKGFAVVSGDVGAGKTLLTRLLLARLGPNVRTAVVTNTRLTPKDLLSAICREFEISTPPESGLPELSRALEEFLLQQYARDRIAVVILDEAQNLPVECFEELRLLGNLEADDAKLLQVLILGQPELQHTLRRPELRQLHQRIFRAFHLPALNREMTAGYITHRLRVAGLPEEREIFTADAIDAVYHHSDGIPRLINQICDNVLIGAYTRSAERVDAALVNEIAEQMMVRMPQPAARAPKSAFARHFVGPPPADASATAAAIDVAEIAEMRRQAAAFLEEIGVAAREASRRGRETRVEVDREAEFERQAAEDALQKTERQVAALRQQVSELLAAEKADLEAARQMREQTTEAVRELTAQLRESARQTERLQADAASVVEDLRRQAREALEANEKQNAIVQRQVRQALNELHSYTHTQKVNMSRLIEEEKAGFQNARKIRQQATALFTEAAAAAEEARNRAEEIKRQTEGVIRDELTAALKQIEERVAEALRRTEAVSRQSSNTATDFGEKVRHANQQLLAAIDDAHRAADEVKARGRDSLTEVRELLLQMTDRAAAIQADIVRVGDDVQNAARSGAAAVQRTGVTIAGKIAAFRDDVTREVGLHYERMLAARRDADQAVTRLQQTAGVLLGRAHDAAAELSEKADRLLADARTSAAQSATQAAEILARADEVAQRVSSEIRDMRLHAIREGEETRESIHAAKIQMIEARDDFARTTRQLLEAQEQARARAEELIRHGEEVCRKTEELLAMPREQIDEAGRCAAALAQLSRNTSRILEQLGDTAREAVDRKENVERAVAQADEKLEILRSQTSRVGQLVGIVRQLYGSMDARARIAQIRSRLEQADELCRSVVPKEMENLRSVLSEQLSTDEARPVGAPPRPGRARVRPPAVPVGSKAPQGPTPAAGAPAQASLGEIVARNRKLNEWLKETLGETQSPPQPAADDRNRVTLTSRQPAPPAATGT